MIQILDSEYLLFSSLGTFNPDFRLGIYSFSLCWISVFNVLTKHRPQVADSEIGKSVFESKNKSLSSDFISLND